MLIGCILLQGCLEGSDSAAAVIAGSSLPPTSVCRREHHTAAAHGFHACHREFAEMRPREPDSAFDTEKLFPALEQKLDSESKPHPDIFTPGNGTQKIFI